MFHCATEHSSRHGSFAPAWIVFFVLSPSNKSHVIDWLWLIWVFKSLEAESKKIVACGLCCFVQAQISVLNHESRLLEAVGNATAAMSNLTGGQLICSHVARQVTLFERMGYFFLLEVCWRFWNCCKLPLFESTHRESHEYEWHWTAMQTRISCKWHHAHHESSHFGIKTSIDFAVPVCWTHYWILLVRHLETRHRTWFILVFWHHATAISSSRLSMFV